MKGWSIALEDVTPDRMAIAIWWNLFCCPVLNDESKPFTLLQRDLKMMAFYNSVESDANFSQTAGSSKVKTEAGTISQG